MNRVGLEVAGAVIGVVLLFLFIQAERANGKLTDQLKVCGQANGQLTAKIKSNAVEEGKLNEQLEARHLADCRDAYDAGAKRLRDDKAIAAGRYLPGAGAGKAGR